MLISETTDIDKIKHVLCDPEIYGRITDDGSPSIEEFEPVKPCHEVYYLTDENNVGLVFLHWINSVTLVGHVQILKDGRAKAMEFGKEALNWIWENTPAQKITVTIPELYPDVERFVIKQGFQHEGVSKKSHLKNGKLYDQSYLGLSRYLWV